MNHNINTQAIQVFSKPFSIASLKYLAKATVSPQKLFALLTAKAA